MVYADGVLIFQELLEIADLGAPLSFFLCARIIPFFSLGLSLYLFMKKLGVTV